MFQNLFIVYWFLFLILIVIGMAISDKQDHELKMKAVENGCELIQVPNSHQFYFGNCKCRGNP